MSDRFRNVALTSRGMSMTGQERQEPSFQREYAESTQQYVDEEIARIIDVEYAKARKILEERRGILDSVSAALLEKETLDEKEFKGLLGLTSANILA
jgi:cell division protease FtsH